MGRVLIVGAAACLLFADTASAASAPAAMGSTRADAGRPRVDQIDDRLSKIEQRVRQESAAGRLSGSKAKQLENNLSAIREQAMAERRANGGFLTPAQTRQLEQQLTALESLLHSFVR